MKRRTRKRMQVFLVTEQSNEPLCDLASCMECEWSGLVSECDHDEEGDWETGYYSVEICPECGGGIDYGMSEQRGAEWEAWWKLKTNQKGQKP